MKIRSLPAATALILGVAAPQRPLFSQEPTYGLCAAVPAAVVASNAPLQCEGGSPATFCRNSTNAGAPPLAPSKIGPTASPVAGSTIA